jgi:serine/threonine-protein kinase
MGRVYNVRNVISNREEAMKILLPDFASDPDLAARFMAEIRTLATLEHPGITQLRTAFQSQDQFVMVMEFVDGTTLDKRAAQGAIPTDQVLDYAIQALAALGYAHGCGVTHRDIKPGNIMITARGIVKLMDFGIAKSANDVQLTRPGTTMGSAYYMSPEQVRGGAIDGRSDIYSFGVMLYELLAGRKPFVSDSAFSLLNAHLNETPAPPIQVNSAISPELNDVVLRAMAKLPDERFQTAEQFLEALKAQRAPRPAQIPQSEPEPPATITKSTTVPQPVAGRRALWIGIGAAAATVALIAVAALLPRMLATHADQKPASAPVQTQTPGPAGTTPPAPSNAEGNQTGASLTGSGASSHKDNTRPSKSSNDHPRETGNQGEETASGQTNSSSSAASAEHIREMRDAQMRYDNLQARADAASSGVETFRRQQQAQGMVIRSDIIEAMNLARRFMSQAHTALGNRELAEATEYMNRADAEITKVEKFLGR